MAEYFDPQRPVFGELMELIHPFDFFELIQAAPAVKQVGVTGIPVASDGRWYLSAAEIDKVGDRLYCVTTTVPAKTTKIA